MLIWPGLIEINQQRLSVHLTVLKVLREYAKRPHFEKSHLHLKVLLAQFNVFNLNTFAYYFGWTRKSK